MLNPQPGLYWIQIADIYHTSPNPTVWTIGRFESGRWILSDGREIEPSEASAVLVQIGECVLRSVL